MMMKISLYFDGITQSTQHFQANSALMSLFAFGQTKVLNADANNQSLHDLLCTHCGLIFESDCPVAALTHLGDVDEMIEQTKHFWLLATPVHLTLQRDFFSLTEALTPSETDTQMLIKNLNSHFADEGYEFSVTPSQQWLLKVSTKRALLTTPVSQVIGRDTRPFMPRGADAAWAAQLTNEIQMLLFEHPVNQAREDRGELAVNSIWLSGTGALPQTAQIKKDSCVYAANAFVKGLAKHTKIPAADIPHSIRQVLTDKKSSHHLACETIIWIDPLKTKHDWFEEILMLLRQRKIKRIKLYFDFSGKVTELSLSCWDVWKFWCKYLSNKIPI